MPWFVVKFFNNISIRLWWLICTYNLARETYKTRKDNSIFPHPYKKIFFFYFRKGIQTINLSMFMPKTIKKIFTTNYNSLICFEDQTFLKNVFLPFIPREWKQNINTSHPLIVTTFFIQKMLYCAFLDNRIFISTRWYIARHNEFVEAIIGIAV